MGTVQRADLTAHKNLLSASSVHITALLDGPWVENASGMAQGRPERKHAVKAQTVMRLVGAGAPARSRQAQGGLCQGEYGEHGSSDASSALIGLKSTHPVPWRETSGALGPSKIEKRRRKRKEGRTSEKAEAASERVVTLPFLLFRAFVVCVSRC